LSGSDMDRSSQIRKKSQKNISGGKTLRCHFNKDKIIVIGQSFEEVFSRQTILN